MLETSPKEIINKAKQEILIKKSPENALEILLQHEEIFNSGSGSKTGIYPETLAFAYQEKKDYAKASELYCKSGNLYQSGFCELLQGNESEAKKLWDKCPPSPASQWGKCLLDFINLKSRPLVPSYLQVRNFLEMDISYFITANKVRYAENVIKNEEVLISINLESYKLIGRVLLNYGFLNMSKKYLMKSIDLVDQDSETFFHLGQLYYEMKAYNDCITTLEKCLELNPNYIPAYHLTDKTRLKMASRA